MSAVSLFQHIDVLFKDFGISDLVASNIRTNNELWGKKGCDVMHGTVLAFSWRD